MYKNKTYGFSIALAIGVLMMLAMPNATAIEYNEEDLGIWDEAPVFYGHIPISNTTFDDDESNLIFTNYTTSTSGTTYYGTGTHAIVDDGTGNYVYYRYNTTFTEQALRVNFAGYTSIHDVDYEGKSVEFDYHWYNESSSGNENFRYFPYNASITGITATPASAFISFGFNTNGTITLTFWTSASAISKQYWFTGNEAGDYHFAFTRDWSITEGLTMYAHIVLPNGTAYAYSALDSTILVEPSTTAPAKLYFISWQTNGEVAKWSIDNVYWYDEGFSPDEITATTSSIGKAFSTVIIPLLVFSAVIGILFQVMDKFKRI